MLFLIILFPCGGMCLYDIPSSLQSKPPFLTNAKAYKLNISVNIYQKGHRSSAHMWNERHAAEHHAVAAWKPNCRSHPSVPNHPKWYVVPDMESLMYMKQSSFSWMPCTTHWEIRGKWWCYSMWERTDSEYLSLQWEVGMIAAEGVWW